MGLNKQLKTPCGFCFVEYDTRESALNACRYLNYSLLDSRRIKVDIDIGFTEGR